MEVFIQRTFYVGVPMMEMALQITKEVFEAWGIEFTPMVVYDTNQPPTALNKKCVELRRVHTGDIPIPEEADDLDSEQMQRKTLIHEYHWGAYIRVRTWMTRAAPCARWRQ